MSNAWVVTAPGRVEPDDRPLDDVLSERRASNAAEARALAGQPTRPLVIGGYAVPVRPEVTFDAPVRYVTDDGDYVTLVSDAGTTYHVHRSSMQGPPVTEDASDA